MLKARDIMRRGVACVKRQTSAYEAADLVIKNDFTCLPVVEDDMTLVGIIGEKELLRLFYSEQDEENCVVESFMTQPVACYEQDDTLKTVIDSMLINFFRTVPVTSKDVKVVGIITRPDVLAYILHAKRAGVTGHSLP
jgi:CBS domain-containing protein